MIPAGVSRGPRAPRAAVSPLQLRLGLPRPQLAPQPLPHRFWPKVQLGPPDACWGWLGALSAKRHGTTRGVIQDTRDGVSRLLLAHRVALWLADDPFALDLDGYRRPDLPGWQACHRCGQRLCCNPRHLYWGTPADNIRDRYQATAAAVVAGLAAGR